MQLKQAEKIAEEVVKRLSPYCSRIEVAGSIRRQKPTVNDIDIVLIPSDPWNLSHVISGLGPVKLMGDKLKRVIYKGVQVDLYQGDELSWGTLLLIRTGPKENNSRLCSLAKKKGWHLTASGAGLFDANGRRIGGDTEESIYRALGLPYEEPWQRG